MKDYHINAFYSEDDEGYIADIPDLPQCMRHLGRHQKRPYGRSCRPKRRGWRPHARAVNLYQHRAIVRSFIKPCE